MEETREVYEAPMVTEAGEFAEVTRGGNPFGFFDGAPPPRSYYGPDGF
ncbi:lasso RiPP family leader peptide-containing protein [Streptomyces sp. NPDC052101]